MNYASDTFPTHFEYAIRVSQRLLKHSKRSSCVSQLQLHGWCISINVACQMHVCCISPESLMHLMQMPVTSQIPFCSSSWNFWWPQMHPSYPFIKRILGLSLVHLKGVSLTFKCIFWYISGGSTKHFGPSLHDWNIFGASLVNLLCTFGCWSRNANCYLQQPTQISKEDKSDIANHDPKSTLLRNTHLGKQNPQAGAFQK